MSRGKTSTWIMLSFKSVKLFKLLKSAKLIKALVSFISMALFAVCQSAIMGVAMGLSVLALLFVHEMGHVLALRRKGFPLRLPIFIPMLGAIIAAPKMDDRRTEAYIGIAGPLIGTAGAIAAGLPYLLTGSHFWVVVSFIGVFLNLFNMIPLSPLDGGRITQAVHRNFRYIGFAMLLAVTLMLGEPGNLVIWMIVVFDMDTIRIRKRVHAMAAIWALMFSLTVAGVGNADTANAADVIIGGFYLSFLTVAFSLKGGKKREAKLIELEEEMRDKRPDCAMQERLRWLGAWAGLILLQVACLFAEAPLIKTLK
jgi:Zn-dependent protease